MLFLAKLNGDPVAITAGGLVPITKPLIVTVISTSPTEFHSGQTHDACAVPATILQWKIQKNVESFTLTAKLNAISENLSFLLRACVQDEVTGIHKFYRREIFFIGTFYVSFS